ncbi:hypothetical protein HYW18_01615 [Candidatus Uhrbacteria bacterium]|nr:hypothetical protein [Candidatus Uhrbacteria bacterium]
MSSSFRKFLNTIVSLAAILMMGSAPTKTDGENITLTNEEKVTVEIQVEVAYRCVLFDAMKTLTFRAQEWDAMSNAARLLANADVGTRKANFEGFKAELLASVQTAPAELRLGIIPDELNHDFETFSFDGVYEAIDRASKQIYYLALGAYGDFQNNEDRLVAAQSPARSAKLPDDCPSRQR